MTLKMNKLLDELFPNEYLEVFSSELPSARALNKLGKIDLRKTICLGEPMWEAIKLYD